MAGAEQRLGQISRLGQPVFQQFKDGLPGNNGVLGSGAGERRGSGQSGNPLDIVSGLTQKSRRLNLPGINEYVQMWLDLRIETSEQVPEPQSRTIRNVGIGLRFLVYDQLNEGRQALLLWECARMRKNTGHDRLVLPYEDAQVLQMAAEAVNIAYDPGGAEDTPENIKKRTFVFADLERKAQGIESTTVIDAE